jgi:hypothetical protein
MVMMFVGGVVLLFDEFLILFLPHDIYGAGGFCSCPNPHRGKAVNPSILDNLTTETIRLIFSKPDIWISGGSGKKTGQTVIEDCTRAADYEKIRGD